MYLAADFFGDFRIGSVVKVVYIDEYNDPIWGIAFILLHVLLVRHYKIELKWTERDKIYL